MHQAAVFDSNSNCSINSVAAPRRCGLAVRSGRGPKEQQATARQKLILGSCCPGCSPTPPPPCRRNEERRPRAANCAPVAGAAIIIFSSVCCLSYRVRNYACGLRAFFLLRARAPARPRPSRVHGVGRAGRLVYLVACLCVEIWVAGRSAFAHAQ